MRATSNSLKLGRVRNYFGPLRSYFDVKNLLAKRELPKEQTGALEKQLIDLEKHCQENLPKILKFIKSQ